MLTTRVIQFVGDGIINAFDEDIYIDFVPDIVTVKCIAYNKSAGGEDTLFTLNSELIRDPVCPCLDPGINSMELKHKLEKPVHGSYHFDFRGIDGSFYAPEGRLAVWLEFSAKKRPGL